MDWVDVIQVCQVVVPPTSFGQIIDPRIKFHVTFEALKWPNLILSLFK